MLNGNGIARPSRWLNNRNKSDDDGNNDGHEDQRKMGPSVNNSNINGEALGNPSIYSTGSAEVSISVVTVDSTSTNYHASSSPGSAGRLPTSGSTETEFSTSSLDSRFLTRTAGTGRTITSTITTGTTTLTPAHHSSTVSEPRTCRQQPRVDVNARAHLSDFNQTSTNYTIDQHSSQPITATSPWNNNNRNNNNSNPTSIGTSFTQHQYTHLGLRSNDGNHDSAASLPSSTAPEFLYQPRFVSGTNRETGDITLFTSTNNAQLHLALATATATATSTTGESRTTHLAASVAPATTTAALIPNRSNLSTATELSEQARTRGTSAGLSSGSTTMGHCEVPLGTWDVQENTSEKTERSVEGKNRDGEDSVSSSAVASGLVLTPVLAPQTSEHGSIADTTPDGPEMAGLGTPSTVSTAPSTDEASTGGDSVDKLGLKRDASALQGIEPFTLHRRAPSWETSPRQRHHFSEIAGPLLTATAQPATDSTQQQYWLPSHLSPTNINPHQSSSAWGTPHATYPTSQAPRVASFRNEQVFETKTESPAPYSYPNGDRWQQTRHFAGDPKIPYIPSQGVAAGFRPSPGFSPHQAVARKPPSSPFASATLPTTTSPARNPRNQQRSQGPSLHRQQQTQGGASSASPTPNTTRSSSEILKTLLRKKACLYEPDTSRAVALVTWLVGRVLALEFGYFSRQQLQAGVHACVAEKIDSGTITRTKVNRCMQIILNSCFHYIIPRPDGTEEKGSSFRYMFAGEVKDDTALLGLLPEPWNDISVDKETVVKASSAEVESKPDVTLSPKASPNLKSMPGSPGRDSNDGDADIKRAVLLCFNENVRAAEDVFRCHNEFIRDSAHSSNLQLSAQEWRSFFGKEAASTPLIWGNVGIPVVAADASSGSGNQRKPDLFGRMTRDEAGKFRTTWCAKRYDHDHDICGFAHVEVNGGWLRRNPYVHRYNDEFCPSIHTLFDKRIGPKYFVINECPHGVHCEYAHSHEEMVYHPNRYKAKPCPLVMRGGFCRQGDICPNHHPSDSSRPTGKKSGEGGRPPSSRHGRVGVGGQGASSLLGKNSALPPTGSPILYASPAPVSSLEKQLLMPGLQELFRRHCSVIRAHLRNPGKCQCLYSHFGDDTGVDEAAAGKLPQGTEWV